MDVAAERLYRKGKQKGEFVFLVGAYVRDEGARALEDEGLVLRIETPSLTELSRSELNSALLAALPHCLPVPPLSSERR